MIYPMFALVLLTFAVGFVALNARFRSVRSGKVRVRSYELMDTSALPEDVIRSTRCFNNLFEMPVLFYVACSLHLVLGNTGTLTLTLAWLFVAMRVLQALIHLTYNKVFHRMLVFWAGCACILALWIILLP